MKRQDTMAILKHLVLVIFAVGMIFLAVAAGAGLLNRTPLRRPLRRERQG